MTQNGKHLKKSYSTIIEQNYQNLRNQVKVLNIQNQKLLEIIDRLKEEKKNEKGQRTNDERFEVKVEQNDQFIQQFFKQNRKQFTITILQPPKKQKHYQKHQMPFPTNSTHIIQIQKYKTQLSNALQKFKQKQHSYQKQIDQLIKSHKSLAIECKMYQNQKQRYLKQNQHLINLLKLKQKQKQTCYGNYSYFDKVKIQYQKKGENNVKVNTYEINNNMGGNKMGGNKVAIQKIKTQYEQNLKQYKQNVYNEVENMFQTITSTLQQISIKLNLFEQKLIQMQNIKHLLSIKKKQSKSNINSHLTSQQLQLLQASQVKSAIYIQQAPSSQRISSNSDKNSRGHLSVILEQSRKDNSKLEIEIQNLRKEVSYYKARFREVGQNNNNQYANMNNEYKLNIKNCQECLVYEKQLQNKILQENKLKQTIEQINSSLQDKQSQMLNQIQKLHSIIESIQQKIKKQKHKNQQQLLQLSKTNQESNHQIRTLQNQIIKLNSQIQTLHSIQSLQQQSNYQLLKSMQQKFANQTNQIQQFIKTLQNQNNQLMNINKNLSQIVNEKSVSILELQKYIKKYKEMLMNDNYLEYILRYVEEMQKYVEKQQKNNQINQEQLIQQSIENDKNYDRINDKLMKLSQQNNLLKQQIKYLKATITVHQKQSQERKKFCQSLINKSQQINTNNRNTNNLQKSIKIRNIQNNNKNKEKNKNKEQYQQMKQKANNAKNRIQQLIQFQKTKINQLVELINLQVKGFNCQNQNINQANQAIKQ